MSGEEPVEGSPSEKSKIEYQGNRIPVVLLIAWVILFVWIAAYVALYLIPALPK